MGRPGQAARQHHHEPAAAGQTPSRTDQKQHTAPHSTAQHNTSWHNTTCQSKRQKHRNAHMHTHAISQAGTRAGGPLKKHNQAKITSGMTWTPPTPWPAARPRSSAHGWEHDMKGDDKTKGESCPLPALALLLLLILAIPSGSVLLPSLYSESSASRRRDPESAGPNPHSFCMW